MFCLQNLDVLPLMFRNKKKDVEYLAILKLRK